MTATIDTGDQRNKSHKGRTSGKKADKKSLHSKKKRGLDTEPNRGSNFKAFTGPSQGSRKVKQAERAIEKRETQMHLPTSDKTFSHLLREPPLLVAVVGPAGVGKTTLIRSMTKFYTNRNLRQVKGPVTMVAGRSRRVTFVEVPNTLTAMCDVAKICDLVILMVDGSFGFEMETFEFLNIAQTHGFPRVVGCVTHLDKLKTSKHLKKVKTMMRTRFHHEVAVDAKLLTLAPMIHGQYRASDVLKMHRLIICSNIKPQKWRNTHSCVFIDRHEDLTSPDAVAKDPDCDRTVAFFGYVRGHPMKPGQLIHIPGLGDFPVEHLSNHEDPCPAVENQGKAQGAKLRHLNDKHRRIYAPHCDLGGITVEDDAAYVYEDQERENIERSGQGLEMLRELQQAHEALDSKLGGAELQMTRRRPVAEGGMDAEPEVEDSSSESSSDDDNEDDQLPTDLSKFGGTRGGAAHAGGQQQQQDAEEDEDEDDGPSLEPMDSYGDDCTRITESLGYDWTEEVTRRALKNMFVTGNWGKDGEEGADDDEDGAGPNDGEDDKGYESVESEDEDWEDIDAPALVANANKAPAMSKKKAEVAEAVAAATAIANADPSIQSHLDFFLGRGDGEDKQPSSAAAASSRGIGGASHANGQPIDFVQSLDETDRLLGLGREGLPGPSGAHGDDDDAPPNPDDAAEADRLAKKLAKKKLFDDEYDGKQGKNNTNAYYRHLLDEEEEKKKRLEDTLEMVGEDLEKRIAVVGYFSGLYVRIVVKNVPVEFLRNFDPTIPMFAGGLNPGEEQMAILHARVKRHRWYPKILKAQDPLCISMGWRRIQTQPVFATEDPNGRHRYLKYTPKHLHCLCAFYGPVTPPNSGFIAIPVQERKMENFRPLATGYTIGVDAASSIVKKLKITGTPEKISKTTCFVKGMFSSDIEAAKFVGAKLKTVSGLRGAVKKVMKGKGGLVRCTFEDKLLKSDIVFIRAWKSVDIPRFCKDVPNLLVKDWRGMKTMAEIRREKGISLQQNPDSQYQEEIRRVKKDLDPAAHVDLVLSRSTKAKLPFEMKEDYIPLERTKETQQRVKEATLVAPDPSELKRKALLSMFQGKAESMSEQRREARARNRIKSSREHGKDMEHYEQELKKAKKETARKTEFRSQHKSRKK